MTFKLMLIHYKLVYIYKPFNVSNKFAIFCNRLNLVTTIIKAYNFYNPNLLQLYWQFKNILNNNIKIGKQK